MKIDRILDKLGEMEVDGRWKRFDSNRFGKELMIKLVMYRIDMFRDFEIHEDWLRFRKIIPPNQLFGLNGSITYTLVFMPDTGELTEKEKNLEVQIKPYDKKKFTVALGRAI